MTQLDLFQPSTGRVILFPLHRRVQFVRAVALTIQQHRTKKAKQAYWDGLIANLKRDMAKGGCSQQSIYDDLSRFWEAVSREMPRRRSTPSSIGGDAA